MIALLLRLWFGCAAVEPAGAVAEDEDALPPVVPARASGGPPPAEPPDILLITVDGLRADHLGSYGYPRETSPGLDQLAARGVLFERAYATAPWEVPALTSLHTGLYPGQHGLDRGELVGDVVSGQPRLNEAVDTLAERLAKAGYQTWALSGTPHVTPRSGLEQGFERLVALRPGEDALAALQGWEADERPRFIWVHLRDPRGPYEGRSPWFEGWAAEPAPQTALARQAPDADRDARQAGLGETIAAYDSEIRAVDSQITALVGALAADPGAVVLVLGAEGEELRDHGRLGRRSTLYDEQVRVPLIVLAPGATAGTRVQSPVSGVDVLPTLLALATGRSPQDLPGVDLAPALRGEALPARLIPLELRVTESRFLRGLVWDRWKLILAEGGSLETRARLYDLETDPGELQDLAAREPDRLRRMMAALAGWRGDLTVLRPAPAQAQPPVSSGSP